MREAASLGLASRSGRKSDAAKVAGPSTFGRRKPGGRTLVLDPTLINNDYLSDVPERSRNVGDRHIDVQLLGQLGASRGKRHDAGIRKSKYERAMQNRIVNKDRGEISRLEPGRASLPRDAVNVPLEPPVADETEALARGTQCRSRRLKSALKKHRVDDIQSVTS